MEVAKQVPGEIREIDLYFTPNSITLPTELGILARLAATACLFEPYRNPVTLKEISECLLKLFSISAALHREAKRNKQRLKISDLPEDELKPLALDMGM